jgi:hypothetical protein
VSKNQELSIFISHSSKDDKIVNKIGEILTDYNISYFVDHDHGLETKKVFKEIGLGFKKSTDLLLIWSDSAAESENVLDEINAANSAQYKKRIHIFIIDGTQCPLPFQHAGLFHHKIDETNVNTETKQLIKSLEGINFEAQIKLYKERIVKDYETFPNFRRRLVVKA